eukprot:3172326-Amphidinium_carterae.1
MAKELEDDLLEFASAEPLFQLNAGASAATPVAPPPKKRGRKSLLEHHVACMETFASSMSALAHYAPATVDRETEDHEQSIGVSTKAVDPVEPIALAKLWVEDGAGKLVPIASQGFASSTSLASVCHAVATSIGLLESEDKHTRAIAEHHFTSNYHVSTGAVLEEKFGMELRSILTRLDRLAASLSVLDRYTRHKLEKDVINCVGKYGLVYYCDLASYDESPMYTAIKKASADGEQ